MIKIKMSWYYSRLLVNQLVADGQFTIERQFFSSPYHLQHTHCCCQNQGGAQDGRRHPGCFEQNAMKCALQSNPLSLQQLVDAAYAARWRCIAGRISWKIIFHLLHVLSAHIQGYRSPVRRIVFPCSQQKCSQQLLFYLTHFGCRHGVCLTWFRKQQEHVWQFFYEVSAMKQQLQL